MTSSPAGSVPLTVLSESELAWRDQVQAFAEQRVRPRVAEMDAARRFAPDLVEEMFGAGLMAVEIPEAFGGAGLGPCHSMLAIEELARVDPSVAVLADVQNVLVAGCLLRHGTGDQRRRHLPGLATGTIGAFAISEEDAGSDAFALSTVAEAADGGYVLRGRKRWITNGAEAGLFLVFARVTGGPPAGVTVFLVEGGSAGLTVGEPVAKLGIRASSTCDLILDGVRVRREDVLGRVGEGQVLGVTALTIGKIGIAAQLVGLAQGALDTAVSYASERRQFGEPISSFQGVGFPLADLAARIEAARLLVYNTARLAASDGGSGSLVTAAAMAKLVASDVAALAATRAVDTLGGNGFTDAYPAEKFYRDAKVGSIYEGTTNMQLRTIAAALFRGRGAGRADRATIGRLGERVTS